MTTSIQKDALLSRFSVLAYKDSAYLDNPANLPAGWELANYKIEGSFAGFAFSRTCKPGLYQRDGRAPVPAEHGLGTFIHIAVGI